MILWWMMIHPRNQMQLAQASLQINSIVVIDRITTYLIRNSLV